MRIKKLKKKIELFFNVHASEITVNFTISFKFRAKSWQFIIFVGKLLHFFFSFKSTYAIVDAVGNRFIKLPTFCILFVLKIS